MYFDYKFDFISIFSHFCVKFTHLLKSTRFMSHHFNKRPKGNFLREFFSLTS